MTNGPTPLLRENCLNRDWDQRRLKHLVRFVGGATPSTDEPTFWNGDIPWVSPKDMKLVNISDTEDHISELGLASCSSQRVPSGNVLVVVRSGILRHTLPVAINVRDVALNQDMKALISRHGLVARFLRYILMAHQPAALESIRKQGATVESIDQTLLSNMVISFPDLDRQITIADFLDRETAEADALVAKYERLIELLEEKRVAVILKAVTRGIDSNVPTKYSGVQALGVIPEDWAVSPLRRVLSTRSGNLIPADIHKEGLEHDIAVYGSTEIIGFTNQRPNLLCDSILLARVGQYAGKVSVAIAPAWVSDNALILTLNQTLILPEYAKLLLRSLNLNDQTTKTAQPLLTGATVKAKIAPVPPLDAQPLIIAFVKALERHIDALKQKAQEAISLLVEHRSALITAAVTGQIDVSTYRAKKQLVAVLVK